MHLAKLSVSRLIAITEEKDSSSDEKVEMGALDGLFDEMCKYLQSGFKYAEIEYESHRKEQGVEVKQNIDLKKDKKAWSRLYFREWVLMEFCDHLVSKLGPTKTFRFLEDRFWFTKRIVHNPVAREMDREANNAIGRYFHSRQSELDNENGEGEDFIRLIDRLVTSKSASDRATGFHLIRHTRPTYGEYRIKINEKLLPFVSILAKDHQMKRNNKFLELYSANFEL